MTVPSHLRISEDKRNDELGVGRQRKSCPAAPRAKGWSIVEEYVDNDKSADTDEYRPEFERLMADIKAGRIDSVVVYNQDRLVRDPRQLEEVLDRLDSLGVPVEMSQRALDGISVDDRLQPRIVGAFAKAELERLQQRSRDKQQELAEGGRPVGLGASQPFGYERGGMEINEEEAAILRQAAADVLAGIPFTSVATRWNEAGVRNPFPRQTRQGWRANSVKALLISPRPAGLRRHREDGEIALYPAAWPPILDKLTHDRLVALLGAKGRTSLPRRRSLLTGLVRCGACGATMMRNAKHGRAVIECPHGPGTGGCNGVSLGADLVEAAVIRRVTAHVAERAATGVDRIMAQGADSEAAQLAYELHQAEQTKLRLAEKQALVADFDDAEIAAMRRANKARIAELRARLDGLTEQSTLARWDTVEAFQAEFAAADTDTRRGLLARIIDHATVLPYAGKRRDPGRVLVDFRK